jgi:hypothetical protein
MTKFAFEVPLKHLEDFDEDQDFHFTLSFLFENQVYNEYFHKITEAGDKSIWVDNSTNEMRTPESCSGLAKLFKSIDPEFVIAPDHPDWNQETMLLTAVDLSLCNVPVDRIMVIVHHPDWIGHFRSYNFNHFAAPYDFRYCTREKLKRFSTCHFLGLVSVDEIKIAQPPTCDTSMPIKIALEGASLKDWISAGCPHVHTTTNFFGRKMTTTEIKLAKKNIQELKKLTTTEEDVVNHPVHYNRGKIEVLDFIRDQDAPYLAGQVLKYICRYRFKNGLEDLKKAEFYLKRLIKETEDESSCA